MRTDDIDVLLATVQFSSLNQAVGYLGIAQSAITRRLQRLGQELNVTLLERQTRPLTLTAAGHRVYEQCLSIKCEAEKLYSLSDPQGEPRSALRLGVPQGLSEIALPATLLALGQQLPGLSSQIICGWSGRLQRRLENGGLDDMLAMGPAQQGFAEGYSGRLLCPLEVVPTVGRRLSLRVSSLREYTKQGWILSPGGCSLRAGLIHELQSRGLRLKLNVEGTDAQLQIALAAQGLGLGLVPRAALANNPWRDKIAVFNLSDFQPTVSLWLIHTQYLANLRPPPTFFANKVAQQLTVSD